MEIAAVFLSAAAFVLAYASLHLTSLRAADIEVDGVEAECELDEGGFSGPHPESRRVRLGLFVSNGGARGGLVDSVSVAGLDVVAEEPFWIDIEDLGVFVGPAGSFPRALPLALESGDVRTVYLLGDLLAAPLAVEDQARRVLGQRSMILTVEWTFVRTNGWWRVLPWGPKGRRERVTRTVPIEIDLQRFRESTLTYWREQYPALAESAESSR